MSKIQTENNRANFFPGKVGVKPPNGKRSMPGIIPERNDLERQNEIRMKTEKDALVSIPEKVKDYARIRRAVDSSPEKDNTEKISRLKEQIANGTYEVDYDTLAEKMLQMEY